MFPMNIIHTAKKRPSTRIEDLSVVGTELSPEQLQLVLGGDGPGDMLTSEGGDGGTCCCTCCGCDCADYGPGY
jgi:hypothetical protein